MALDKHDLDKIRALIAEAIEELILPKFETVNARLEGLDRRLEKLDGNTADLRTNQADLIDALQGKKVISSPAAKTLRSRLFGRAA